MVVVFVCAHTQAPDWFVRPHAMWALVENWWLSFSLLADVVCIRAIDQSIEWSSFFFCLLPRQYKLNSDGNIPAGIRAINKVVTSTWQSICARGFNMHWLWLSNQLRRMRKRHFCFEKEWLDNNVVFLSRNSICLLDYFDFNSNFSVHQFFRLPIETKKLLYYFQNHQTNNNDREKVYLPIFFDLKRMALWIYEAYIKKK